MAKFMLPRLLLSLIFASLTISINAQIPQVINYQGQLTDIGGTPVADGLYLIKFRLYDDPTAGTTLWDSDFRTIQVTDGLFSYMLGDTVTIPATVFTNNSNVYLGIKVSADPELSPRNKITSVGFSYHSLLADSAKVAGNSKLLDNLPSLYYLDWGNLTGMPAGFADGIDNEGSGGGGDITSVTAGSGLTGGGISGDVSLSIGAGAIANGHLATNSVTSDKILNQTINGNDIVNNSLAGTHLINNTITFNKMGSNGAAEGEVMKMIGGNWTAEPDETGSGGDITAVNSGSGLIGGGTSGDVTLSVGTGAITSDHIANNSVGTDNIQINSVTTNKIANYAITHVKIDDGAVNGSKIAASSIDHNHIVNGEVNSDEIAADAVTSSKILDGAVTSSKIYDGTITSVDIASGGVAMSNINQSGATESQAITWSESEDVWQPSTVGDITSVYGTELGGLVGGGTEGDVGLSIEYQGVNSYYIQDNTIVDEDISASADIEPSKIRGGAVNHTDAQLIEGDKTFLSLSIGTTTRKLAVPSAAFVPSRNTYSFSRNSSYLRNTVSSNQVFVAPVFLPDGAIVTKVKVTYYDNEASYDGHIDLVKVYMYGGGEILMASEGTSGTPGFSTVTDNTIISETVSNDGYNYYLSASMTYSSNSLNMRLYGAEIEYTITKPLP